MQLVRSPSSAQLLFDNLPVSLLELSLNGLQLGNAELLVAGLERLVKLSKLRLCGVPAVDDNCLKQVRNSGYKCFPLIDTFLNSADGFSR